MAASAARRQGCSARLKTAVSTARRAHTLRNPCIRSALVFCILNVFTNSKEQCILAICFFHPRPNCLSPFRIASGYWRSAVIAAHPEELFCASTLSLGRPRELPITFWHATYRRLCPPYCCGGGDFTAAA